VGSCADGCDASCCGGCGLCQCCQEHHYRIVVAGSVYR
jgi:hypothetical protein